MSQLNLDCFNWLNNTILDLIKLVIFELFKRPFECLKRINKHSYNKLVNLFLSPLENMRHHNQAGCSLEEWPHWAAIVIFGVLKPIHEKRYWQKHTQSNFPSINRSPNKLSLRNP